MKAKIIDGILNVVNDENYDDYRKSLINASGYKQLIVKDKPTAIGLQGVKEIYTENDDDIEVNYQVVDFDRQKILTEIDRLKDLLNNTDYKIIKCYEANLLNQTLSYDINLIHCERQFVRDRINELESLAI